jgi:hypothetical protein
MIEFLPAMSGEEFVMRIVSRVLLAALACAAFTATSFAGGPFGIIRVGKWQGAAYTTDKGAFSFCVATAKFPNGAAIILFQNADRSWLIGFAGQDWNLSGRSLAVVLAFDGQARFDLVGIGSREKFALAPLPTEALDALRKAHLLVVTASKRNVDFDLAAAGNVVASIENALRP